MSVTCVSAPTPTLGRLYGEWRAGCWLFSSVKQNQWHTASVCNPLCLCLIFLKMRGTFVISDVGIITALRLYHHGIIIKSAGSGVARGSYGPIRICCAIMLKVTQPSLSQLSSRWAGNCHLHLTTTWQKTAALPVALRSVASVKMSLILSFLEELLERRSLESEIRRWSGWSCGSDTRLSPDRLRFESKIHVLIWQMFCQIALFLKNLTRQCILYMLFLTAEPCTCKSNTSRVSYVEV